MKTETLIADLKAAVRSGKGNYGHRLLCGQAAERITSLMIALKAAEKDLTVVEREINGIAPEAKSTALPLVRFALGISYATPSWKKARWVEVVGHELTRLRYSIDIGAPNVVEHEGRWYADADKFRKWRASQSTSTGES